MKHSRFRHEAQLKRPGMSMVENRAQRNLSNWQHYAEPEFEGISAVISAIAYIAFFAPLALGTIWISRWMFACSEPILGVLTAILGTAFSGLAAFLTVALICFTLQGVYNAITGK